MTVRAEPIITLKGLHKAYGDVVAVDGVSFEVGRGQVFCIVGPNGAGKTTTLECLLGLTKADRGTLRVLGLDPARQRTELFRRAGVQLQENSFHAKITAEEALHLFRDLHTDPLDPEELLQTFDLEHRRKARYMNLSGGEKRKLLIAIALIGDPDLVVLDEPGSGLDPHARKRLWEVLHGFRAERGLTILLTTHDMQEAQTHSDVVCLMDSGQIIAQGAPQRLLDEYGLGTRVTVPVDAGVEASAFEACPGLARVDRAERQLHVFGSGDAFADAVADLLREKGVRDYTIRPADLEDLYLMTTGTQYDRANQ